MIGQGHPRIQKKNLLDLEGLPFTSQEAKSGHKIPQSFRRLKEWRNSSIICPWSLTTQRFKPNSKWRLIFDQENLSKATFLHFRFALNGNIENTLCKATQHYNCVHMSPKIDWMFKRFLCSTCIFWHHWKKMPISQQGWSHQDGFFILLGNFLKLGVSTVKWRTLDPCTCLSEVIQKTMLSLNFVRKNIYLKYYLNILIYNAKQFVLTKTISKKICMFQKTVQVGVQVVALSK